MQSPRDIGPYRIHERLGEGGMGVVYRAEHRQSGAAVALKTVKVPHAGMLGSIRREIHALTRLRHPGIVGFVGEGIHEGMPWYAMELIEGTPLREIVRTDRRSGSGGGDTTLRGPDVSVMMAAPTSVMAGRDQTNGKRDLPARRGPISAETLKEVLSLLRRLCGPLAYMHGEGLVHRDLKPDNIVVRPDGMPVLVDFGLMSRFGGEVSRDALEVGGRVSGTWAYMPPEQARGDVVDARADLYALGCILYELITGAPPFGFGSGRNLQRAHAFVRPGPLPAEVPEELQQLAERLLAKAPEERLGHALDVAAALERLGAEDGIEGPEPRPYLYRPLLSGRDDVVDDLMGAVDRLDGGEGGLVLIGGESGLGKTRLALEVARVARQRGIEVLVGECDEQQRGALRGLSSPLQAIADRCRELGAREAERVFGRRAKVLAVAEPSLRQLPGQEAHPEPAELPARDATARLLSCLAEVLDRVAAERPLLLILDDLQWADEVTTALLERGLGDSARVLIIGTYRTEEATEALTRLARSTEAASIDLGRLDEGAVGSMVREMLALGEAPPVFTRFLHERSEGVPFFVAEYLRVAIAEGLLKRDATGAWQVGGADGPTTEETYRTLPIPQSLAELVERRIGNLRGRARSLLELAAVLGREAAVGLLGRATGDPEVSSWEGLEELKSRQILELEGERVRFVHDRIREVGYALIPGPRRRELHQRAAEAIESLWSADLDPHQAELGRHWEMAGDHGRARACYLAAARRAAAAYAHGEAERLYRCYLGLVEEETAETINARNELGEKVLQLRGRPREAEALYREAARIARSAALPRLESESERRLALALSETGRPEEARTPPRCGAVGQPGLGRRPRHRSDSRQPGRTAPHSGPGGRRPATLRGGTALDP